MISEALTSSTSLPQVTSFCEPRWKWRGGRGRGRRREVRFVDVGGGRGADGEGGGGRGSARAGLRFLCAFKYSAICMAYSWEEAAHK
jgi:hypothetical protein